MLLIRRVRKVRCRPHIRSMSRVSRRAWRRRPADTKSCITRKAWIGVYVLVAPEPDRQQPHDDDEVYLVLEGTGVLEVEGKLVELREGHAVFVPAGAEHQFTGYEQLALLVMFERR